MNLIIKSLVLYLCFVSISCEWFRKAPKLRELIKFETQNKTENLRNLENSQETSSLFKKLRTIVKAENNSTKENEVESRKKRQLPAVGGFGVGFGAYDYNDYFGDFVNDYAYDYYDWVCTETACQLCDILTSECCDPTINVNCFLPDSCLNNPCLSGGTCITTRTIAGQPDFVCVCLPGLTGKYCQLTNDYFVGAQVLPPPFMPPLVPAPVPAVVPAVGIPTAPAAPPAPVQQSYDQHQGYGQPQQGYAQPQQGYGQPQQGFAQPQQGFAQPQQSNDGRFVRTLGAKSKPCGNGQIFSADQNKCVDFALKKDN